MNGLARLGISACLAVMSMAATAHAECSIDRVELRGDFGTVRFRVAVADDPAERSQGLMHVPEMPRMAGMLFVYERPQSVSFWMANTLIPLDMIFFDETGVVTRIHENAVPMDRTPIPGGDGVRYVLEINGGLARQLGLDEGDELRHPAIPEDLAVWACDDG